MWLGIPIRDTSTRSLNLRNHVTLRNKDATDILESTVSRIVVLIRNFKLHWALCPKLMVRQINSKLPFLTMNNSDIHTSTKSPIMHTQYIKPRGNRNNEHVRACLQLGLRVRKLS